MARSAPLSPATDRHFTPRREPLRSLAVRGLVRGIAGGLVGTTAMSVAMLAAQKAGLMGQMPPQKISDHILGVLGLRFATPRPARRALATLSHFGFGATCGALFGVGRALLLRDRETGESRLPLLGSGLAFGTAVWALSYAGWVPAAQIMPLPHADRPGRPLSMVVAHWVFGAVVAKITGDLERS